MPLLRILKGVQSDAHGKKVYVTDKEQYGLSEYWRAQLKGDCEDQALWKRAQLKKQGVQSDLILCYTELDECHLVLNVNGWILDNRFKEVKRRDDLDYRWVKLGKPNGKWYEITE